MNSVSNPAVSAAHHAKKPVKSALSGLPAGQGGEFGDLFADMQAETEGQNLAAQTGKASPPIEGLASQILGPSVHIITSETPALSDDSLYAFARSQGMDESALALIFSRSQNQLPEPTAAAVDATALDSQTELAAEGSLSEFTTDALTFAQQRFALQQAADAANKKIPDVAAQPVTDTDGMSALDLGAGATIRWSVSQTGDPLSKPPGDQPEQHLAGSKDAQASQQAAAASHEVAILANSQPGSQDKHLLQQAAQDSKAVQNEVVTMATVQDDEHTAPARDFAATLLIGEAETAQFTKRVLAKQAGLRAERLGTISGDAFKSAALSASLSANTDGHDAPATLEALELGTELTGEDLRMIWEHRQASAGQASDNGSQSSGQGNGPQSDIDLRAEQYEKLTQRLSEALGQRLAAQIARGDWKVELALKPQDLGNIEIRLNMKQGTLEASFDASEAMTRSLIMNGLQQLKDNLAQSGMEVAQVNVNVRQDSQTGGNPTPGRQKSSGSISGLSKGGTAETPPPTTDSMATRKPAIDDDGLDLLV